MWYNRAMNLEPCLFSARQRFNWGFHDAAADALAGRQPLWASLGISEAQKKADDRTYYAGMLYGRRWAREGRYVSGKTLSTEAWADYTGLEPANDELTAAERGAVSD